MSEDEMAGWRHQCIEHELGQTLGDGEGQGSLACCSSMGGCKELDMTGRLNTNNIYISARLACTFTACNNISGLSSHL